MVLILHTYMGLHVIRRTIIFSDLVLDQLAAFGVLIGIGIGIQYGTVGSYLVAMIVVLFGAFLLAVIKPKNRLIPREAVIGIMYALALVASLLLSDKLSEGSAYVTKTLSGSMLWVSWPIVGVTALVYIVLLLFHYRYRAQFITLTELNDRDIPNRLWDFLFFTTQGIITVLVVPVSGVLLAYAFLMIPAAVALMITKDWKKAVIMGWSLGFAACLVGLFSSYYFNLPYGPTLILALGILFMSTLIIRFLKPKQA